MSEPGDKQFPRLFYGNEVIYTLQTNKETEYRNIVEILDYWRQLYKDPQLGIEERNKILNQIRETYLHYEDLLTHFKYEVTMIDEDEDDNKSSSSKKETEDLTRKRKS